MCATQAISGSFLPTRPSPLSSQVELAELTAFAVPPADFPLANSLANRLLHLPLSEMFTHSPRLFPHFQPPLDPFATRPCLHFLLPSSGFCLSWLAFLALALNSIAPHSLELVSAFNSFVEFCFSPFFNLRWLRFLLQFLLTGRDVTAAAPVLWAFLGFRSEKSRCRDAEMLARTHPHPHPSVRPRSARRHVVQSAAGWGGSVGLLLARLREPKWAPAVGKRIWMGSRGLVESTGHFAHNNKNGKLLQKGSGIWVTQTQSELFKQSIF